MKFWFALVTILALQQLTVFSTCSAGQFNFQATNTCFPDKCLQEFSDIASDATNMENNYNIATDDQGDRVLRLTMSLPAPNDYGTDCLDYDLYKISEIVGNKLTTTGNITSFYVDYSKDNVITSDYCTQVSSLVYDCDFIGRYFVKDTAVLIAKKIFTIRITYLKDDIISASLTSLEVTEGDPTIIPHVEEPAAIEENKDLLPTDNGEPVKRDVNEPVQIYTTVPDNLKEDYEFELGETNKDKAPTAELRQNGTDFVYEAQVEASKNTVKKNGNDEEGLKLNVKSNRSGRFRVRTKVFLRRRNRGRFLNDDEKDNVVIQEFDLEFTGTPTVPTTPGTGKPVVNTKTIKETDETAVIVLIIVLVILTVAAVIGGVCAMNRINALKHENKYADKGDNDNNNNNNQNVNIDVQ